MRLVGQSSLFEHDRHFDAIRGGQGIELQPVGMPGRPLPGYGECRKLAHGASCSGGVPILAKIPALACAIGLSGSNGFHILATHSIPAAQANLISYLWRSEERRVGKEC